MSASGRSVRGTAVEGIAGAGKLLGRLIKPASKPPGTMPGTLQHVGERKAEDVVLRLVNYSAEVLEERTLDSIEECYPLAEAPPVTWVNIDGLHDVSIAEAVGERFGVHRLALEDVLDPGQRPKVEDYPSHFLVIVRMLTWDAESESILSEQVSLIVGPGYLFSFQERRGDVFEPVRERIRQSRGKIRSRSTDYLAYALVDTIVDGYFGILEQVGDLIENLEEEALHEATLDTMHRIHHLRREMLVLRRAVWPLREALGQLYRGESELIREETQLFLRDVYDHSIQVIDTVETMRDLLSGAMDLYMTSVSNRMNEVMKVLTIIATIFIPLSFFAGLYGMNFEYMPELGIRWAYPALLTLMVSLGLGMVWVFRRKGWL